MEEVHGLSGEEVNPAREKSSNLDEAEEDAEVADEDECVEREAEMPKAARTRHASDMS